MKFKFDPNLDFQRDAIDSITGLFEGQEICKTNFTVAPLKMTDDLLGSIDQNDLGIGNRIRLLKEDILENLKAIQLRNGLAPSEKLLSMDFTVEMETGTGKTYVYLRSIFEMNRLYGFTKFIIVVPSIAIKEGVKKSLEMTEEHFRDLYDNVPCDYFEYDSQKKGNLNKVRNFATNDYIQIMVINIDAFRRSFDDPTKENKANIIHRPHDRMTGSRPIEFIQSTNPIVIIDEPQSVDTTEKSKEAIQSLNPLCTLRYSATHIDKHHMVYKLDSVDAYERKLVKQIEVAGIEVKDSHNKAYIKLLKVDNRKSPITAQIELDINKGKSGVKRTKKTIRSGDDLLDLSKGRGVYDGYIIEDIHCEKGYESITFTSKPEILRLNQVIGGINEDEYKRLQIRKTVEEHLDKELMLNPKGIKVLSLFFIDRVANYKWYDEDGNPQQGKYAIMFEEEYKRIIQKPKYHTLFNRNDLDIENIHNGYFAIDKKKDSRGKGMYKESKGEGKAKADGSAYHLIMRAKEVLLSFDSKLKFIFSHSALREGWDNPNVFQICTLNETKSIRRRRQEIGRGLRICVNQEGDRVHGFAVNRLTVMANESYEVFAQELQKQIENEQGIRFGFVETHLFANIPIPTNNHKIEYFGMENSELVWKHLKENDFIDSRGKVSDSLRTALKSGDLDLPDMAQVHVIPIMAALRKVSGNLNIKNADDRKQMKLNKAVFLGADFQELWERIKYKTTYRVDFDCEALIEECSKEIKKSLVVGRARFVTRKATLQVDRGGVQAKQVSEKEAIYDVQDYQLPDIVSYLQNETNLTRQSIVKILRRSDKLDHFKKNPQKYIEEVSAIIQRQMRVFIVDGIKYQRIGDQHYYAQELFKDGELSGYLSKNLLKSERSVFDHVLYDSGIEEEFARSFEDSDDIKVYAKLPSNFQIDTPLGGYNPDWAVLVEMDGQEHLYFVVESKGSVYSDTLRSTERAKIDCGREHFKALDTSVDFAVADSFTRFTEIFAK